MADYSLDPNDYPPGLKISKESWSAVHTSSGNVFYVSGSAENIRDQINLATLKEEVMISILVLRWGIDADHINTYISKPDIDQVFLNVNSVVFVKQGEEDIEIDDESLW